MSVKCAGRALSRFALLRMTRVAAVNAFVDDRVMLMTMMMMMMTEAARRRRM